MVAEWSVSVGVTDRHRLVSQYIDCDVLGDRKYGNIMFYFGENFFDVGGASPAGVYDRSIPPFVIAFPQKVTTGQEEIPEYYTLPISYIL